MLTPKLCDILDGQGICLTSSDTKGKLLTIDQRGKITARKSGYDQVWRFIPVDGGYLLVSIKDQNMVCHSPRDGGEVSVKEFSRNTENCVWSISENGEIYQNHEGGDGEKYLWIAKDELFVTLDGHLAERWVPLSELVDPKYSEVKHPHNPTSNYLFVGLVILAIISFIYIFMGK